MILRKRIRFRLAPLFTVGSIFFQISCALPAAAQTPASPQGTKLQITGIPNAGKISDHLFRGAQPQSAAFPELKKLGVTTIVDLRIENAQKVQWERQQSARFGIRFIHIPSSGWAPPSAEQIARFLAVLAEEPQQKVFVHCHFGDDRTGVFIAAYRIAMDHWSTQQATNEMYYFGFNWFWHPSMRTFVQNFPWTLNSSPALLPFRPAKPPA